MNPTRISKQDAKETLLDPAKRANYDKWRNSGINISYKNWLGMKEHVHQVTKITEEITLFHMKYYVAVTAVAKMQAHPPVIELARMPTEQSFFIDF